MFSLVTTTMAARSDSRRGKPLRHVGDGVEQRGAAVGRVKEPAGGLEQIASSRVV